MQFNLPFEQLIYAIAMALIFGEAIRHFLIFRFDILITNPSRRFLKSSFRRNIPYYAIYYRPDDGNNIIMFIQANTPVTALANIANLKVGLNSENIVMIRAKASSFNMPLDRPLKAGTVECAFVSITEQYDLAAIIGAELVPPEEVAEALVQAEKAQYL